MPRDSRLPPTVCLALLGLSLAAGCATQAPKAKVPPRSPVWVDLTTPKAAALTYANALAWGDPKGVRASATGTDLDLRWAEALADFAGGLRTLDDALVGRFGWGTVQENADFAQAVLEVRNIFGIKALEQADQREQDKGVTALMPRGTETAGRKQPPVLVRHLGGAWKVDLALMRESGYGLPEEREEQETIAEYRRTGDMLRALAADVLAGKYATIDQAWAAAADAWAALEKPGRK